MKLPNPLPRLSAVLSSGWNALDQRLGGGWPADGLTEILGRGRSTLALSAVRQAQSAGVPAAWVDGARVFCPATAGVDLARLTLVCPELAPEPAAAAAATPDAVMGAASTAGAAAGGAHVAAVADARDSADVTTGVAIAAPAIPSVAVAAVAASAAGAAGAVPATGAQTAEAGARPRRPRRAGASALLAADLLLRSRAFGL